MSRIPIVASAGLFLGLTAAAQANDCQTVADAYDALGKVAAYRQTVSLNGEVVLEAIAVGDKLYRKDGDSWSAMDLGPGGRAAMQKQAIPGADSLKDCTKVGPDTLDGVDAVMFDYIPPPMAGAGVLVPQRVWISNGLPLRMTTEQSKTDVRISYDNVTAPTP